MEKTGRRETERAFLATFEERRSQGLLIDRDYFEGSYDRWSLALSEITGHVPEKGRILDIGSWEGLFCGAALRLGFSACAIDWGNPLDEATWRKLGIEWRFCQVEADPIPFPDDHFVGVYMGQILEHFTYSPRKPLAEIRRVLKPGGILVIDVPNVGEWHNFYRLLRGKNILYDYKRHYIDTDEEPVFYKGLPYWHRHNREFTPGELRILADACGFEALAVRYIRSIRNGKKGLRRLEVPFSALRDAIPLFRKTVMLTARKPLAG